MTKPLPDAERAAIIAALEAGESVNGVAKRLGVGASSVSRIARATGTELVYASPKRAIDAQRDYNLANRLELLNKLFKQVDSVISSLTDPADLQRIAVTAGILIDKRRLEDGDVTSRTEVQTDHVVAEFDRRIVDLAARRRLADAARGPDAGSPGLATG